MNVLVFGATGSAGGSVLRACLSDPAVREVRAIARRPAPLESPRLRWAVHQDFLRYDSLGWMFEDLNACCFCLGVSSLQVQDESRYRIFTLDYAVAAGEAVRAGSPDARFHFLSGKGTDVEGRAMWARIKGEAERTLMHEVGAVCWRPGFIDGEASATGAWYHGTLRPFFHLMKPFKGLYVSGQDLGRAMLQATYERMERQIVENREIRELARRWSDSGADAGQG